MASATGSRRSAAGEGPRRRRRRREQHGGTAISLATYLGWDVQAVTDGRLALEICWSTELDVVVLDVEMPMMDGPQVLAALRADPRTTSLPVVFVTASTEPALDAWLYALGALAVLAKPFHPHLISDQVAEFLGRR